MDRADAPLNRRIAGRDADGAQRCHLRFTPAPAPRCPQTAGHHPLPPSPADDSPAPRPADVRCAPAPSSNIRRTAEGRCRSNKVEGQQLLPGGCFSSPAKDCWGTIATKRSTASGVNSGLWLGDGSKRAHLHPPLAHHLDHLLINHVMHRNVHPGIAVAKGFQRLRQNVGGKRRHRGDRNFTRCGVSSDAWPPRRYPSRPAADGPSAKRVPLLGKGHFAGAALQQRPPTPPPTL